MTGDSVSDTGRRTFAIDWPVATVAVRVSRGCRSAWPRRRPRRWRGARRSRAAVTLVAEGIPDQVDGAQVLADRGLGHGSEVAGIGLDVEQQAGDVHAAHAIGQRVMELHHQRRLAAVEPLDERVLPQRPISIEAGHPGLAGELQDRRQRLRRRRLEPADVPRQVEVGIDHPARRGQPKRRRHHPVPEPGRQPGRALQSIRQPVPVRRAVEDQDGDHGRAQQRIVLHVPGERVAVAHVNADALGQRPPHLLVADHPDVSVAGTRDPFVEEGDAPPGR